MNFSDQIKSIDNALFKNKRPVRRDTIVYFQNQWDRIGHFSSEIRLLSYVFNKSIDQIITVLPARSIPVISRDIRIGIKKIYEANRASYIFINDDAFYSILGIFNKFIFPVRSSESGNRYIFGNHNIFQTFDFLASLGHESSYQFSFSLIDHEVSNCFDRHGLSRSHPLVTVSNRESGWTGNWGRYHDFRNCSVKNLRLAVETFLANGIQVVRVGDPTQIRFPLENHTGFVDLPFTANYLPGDDAFFIASSSLHVGPLSGPTDLASTLGKPLLVTNANCAVSRSFEGPNRIEPIFWIPKAYTDKTNNDKTISFWDVFTDSEMNEVSNYQDRKIEYHENTEDEINEAIKYILQGSGGDFSLPINWVNDWIEQTKVPIFTSSQMLNASRMSKGLSPFLPAFCDRYILPPTGPWTK
jgi:putative glycosyltransferase (TIGR04372 family)